LTRKYEVTALDSFGIWCKPNKEYSHTESEDEAGCPPIDLHVNLWDIKKSGATPFIDVGILVTDWRAYDSLCLYVPFALSESNLIDLSDSLMDKTTADLVFNEYCSTTTQETGVRTLKREQSEEIILYSFANRSRNKPKLSRSRNADGRDWCIATFDLKGCSQRRDFEGWNRLYLRFRIDSPSIENELFCNIERKNKFLESGFETTRIADIKFNMKRNISNDAIDEMSKDGGIPITMSNIHFLLIEPANKTVDYYGAELAECRKLEDEWGKYLGNKDGEIGDLLAYHWKRKGGVGKVLADYALMARVTRPDTNWKVISTYIAFGIALNIVASWIYACLT
jgi:hypothetical protein